MSGILRELDYDELTVSMRWGGITGLLLLVPQAIGLILVTYILPFFIEIDAGTVRLFETLTRYGCELFLISGWGFGTVSLLGQMVMRLPVGRTAGEAAALLASVFGATLVGVGFLGIFAFVGVETPPKITVAMGTFAATTFLSLKLGSRRR